jgi:hypothetical protein
MAYGGTKRYKKEGQEAKTSSNRAIGGARDEKLISDPCNFIDSPSVFQYSEDLARCCA